MHGRFETQAARAPERGHDTRLLQLVAEREGAKRAHAQRPIAGGAQAQDALRQCVELRVPALERREAGEVDEALETLKGFALGKPVVIEETFPLKCSVEELGRFIDGSEGIAAGWIGFYWGRTPEELRPAETISEALTLGWLEYFRRQAGAIRR